MLLIVLVYMFGISLLASALAGIIALNLGLIPEPPENAWEYRLRFRRRRVRQSRAPASATDEVLAPVVFLEEMAFIERLRQIERQIRTLRASEELIRHWVTATERNLDLIIAGMSPMQSGTSSLSAKGLPSAFPGSIPESLPTERLDTFHVPMSSAFSPRLIILEQEEP